MYIQVARRLDGSSVAFTAEPPSQLNNISLETTDEPPSQLNLYSFKSGGATAEYPATIVPDSLAHIFLKNEACVGIN